jgi:spore coat protein CotF
MEISLSIKERMLLEDQKKHEIICIEKYSNYSKLAQDAQLKQIFNANAQSEQTHLDSINQLLSGRIPQMNQQQGHGTGQAAGNQSTSSINTVQAAGISVSDDSLCRDMLMTEKYVSSTYNTSIFEFKDTRVRDVLNHIQKEEQKHGESIYKYMESKGMY